MANASDTASTIARAGMRTPREKSRKEQFIRSFLAVGRFEHLQGTLRATDQTEAIPRTISHRFEGVDVKEFSQYSKAGVAAQ
jgi:hypothetical protein